MIDEFGGDFFQWLRGFYFVAKIGNVTRAAAEMGRLQPAITHQIKSLESELGVDLFERTKGKMVLTPPGEKLLTKAIAIFELIHELKDELLDEREDLEGKVRIATTQSIIRFVLPEYVAEFSKLYPKVRFNIHGGDLQFILEQVESSDVDFGIFAMENTPDRFESFPLFASHLLLVDSRKKPVLGESTPSLQEIAKVPFIDFHKTTTICQLTDRVFDEAGLSKNKVLELNHFEVIKKYVDLGMGVALLDDYSIFPSDHDRLIVHDMSQHIPVRTHKVITLKRKYISPAAKAFIRTVKRGVQDELSG